MRTLKPILAILILSLGMLSWLFWPRSAPAPQLLSGMVENREITVAPRIAGRLYDVQVAEGDTVRAGQILARIHSPEIETKHRAAQAQDAAARARVQGIRAGARSQEIAAAQAQWQSAQAARIVADSTQKRFQTLQSAGAVTAQQLDEALAKAQSARAQEEAALAKLNLTRAGARPEEIRAAQAQAEAALALTDETQVWRDETVLRSPVDGVVQKIYAVTGELCAPGAPFLTLIQPAKAWVALNLREDQIKAFVPGTQITGDVPGLSLTGIVWKVQTLSPLGDYATWRSTARRGDADLRSFEARLVPVRGVEGLWPGMQVWFKQP